jgi:hypothetical protein
MIIPSELRNCVAFVYYEREDGEKVPAGTAFFVQDPEPTLGPDLTRKYCVTARHVIEQIVQVGHGGVVWLRLNVQGGGFTWISVPLTEWLGHPEEVEAMWSTHRETARIDVSACIWRGSSLHDCGVVAISTSVFLDSARIAEHSVSAGDEIFITGLFAPHIGEKRNSPVIRCGNIAAMPEEPVETVLGPMDAFLVEARSIGGLSGSPVFASIGGTPRRVSDSQFSMPSRWHVFLLGLIHGHWNARSADTVSDGTAGGASINQGIAVVAPASQILETIRHDRFMDIRSNDVQQIVVQRSA